MVNNLPNKQITISKVGESKPTLKHLAKNNKNSKKGIGLENIKKRLEMLHPKNHFLEILQEEKKFRVNLKIPIKNEE